MLNDLSGAGCAKHALIPVSVTVLPCPFAIQLDYCRRREFKMKNLVIFCFFAQIHEVDKEELLNQKIERMRLKNEEIRRRHAEIETDKRNANLVHHVSKQGETTVPAGVMVCFPNAYSSGSSRLVIFPLFHPPPLHCSNFYCGSYIGLFHCTACILFMARSYLLHQNQDRFI